MAQQTIGQQKTVPSRGNPRSHTRISPKASTHVWDRGMRREKSFSMLTFILGAIGTPPPRQSFFVFFFFQSRVTTFTEPSLNLVGVEHRPIRKDGRSAARPGVETQGHLKRRSGYWTAGRERKAANSNPRNAA